MTTQALKGGGGRLRRLPQRPAVALGDLNFDKWWEQLPLRSEVILRIFVLGTGTLDTVLYRTPLEVPLRR